jgi:hypothetical protein
MDYRLTIIALLALGIFLFITSIILRRRRRIRLFLRSIGILVGLIPILLYFAYLLTGYIKERPLIGRYEFTDPGLGKVELQLYNNNTFEMKAKACSSGFVQGRWHIEWFVEEAYVAMESTSQTMGKGYLDMNENLNLTNIPVCLKLIRELKFIKVSESTEKPTEEFTF